MEKFPLVCLKTAFFWRFSIRLGLSFSFTFFFILLRRIQVLTVAWSFCSYHSRSSLLFWSLLRYVHSFSTQDKAHHSISFFTDDTILITNLVENLHNIQLKPHCLKPNLFLEGLLSLGIKARSKNSLKFLGLVQQTIWGSGNFFFIWGFCIITFHIVSLKFPLNFLKCC